MVLQSFCITLMFICGWYHGSTSSICYLALSVIIWTERILNHSTSYYFTMASFLSVALIIAKSILILFGDYTQVSVQHFFGFHSSQASFLLLIPDFIVFILSILAKFHFNFLRTEKSLNGTKVLALIVLSASGIYNCDIPNLFYLLGVVYRVVSFCLKLKPFERALTIFLSSISTIQLVYPYFYQLILLKNIVPNEIFIKFGLIPYTSVADVQLWLICLINIFLTSIASQSYSFSHEDHLASPLKLEKTEEKSEYINKLRFISLYITTVFFLWLWIFRFVGYSGLVIIAWIFYSILCKSAAKLKYSTKYLLLPTLIITMIIFYISYIFAIFEDKKYGLYTFKAFSFECFFILVTILVTCFFYKSVVLFSSQITFHGTVVNLILAFLLKKVYILSIIVLFLIGLSDINVLNSGLVIFFIYFLVTKTENIKNKWERVLYYTMFMLFVRYLWLIIGYQVSHFINPLTLDIVGLNFPEEIFFVIYVPYDFLIWILLISESLQHFANKIEVFQEDYNSEIIDKIKNFYEIISRGEIFIIYALTISVMLATQENFLNLIRFFVFLFILIRHLSHTDEKLFDSFQKSYILIVAFEVFNGILLATRYLFQFQQFFDNELNFSNLGFVLYDEKDNFYTSMASDCAILIASVFISRNCKDRINFFGNNASRSPSKLMKSTEIGIRYERILRISNQIFEFVFIFTIFFLSIYCRLSITMLVMIVIMGFYEIFVSTYFYSVANQVIQINLIQEWNIRAKLWKVIFFIDLFCLLMSYIRFLLKPEIFQWIDFSAIDWYFFMFGFYKEKDSANLIINSYPFSIILIVLIIERHFLEYSHFTLGTFGSKFTEEFKLSEQLLQNNSDLNDPLLPQESKRTSKLLERYDTKEKLKNKIDITKVFVLFKSVSEALIPMFLLLLAFNKITIISVFYVLTVFFDTCFLTLTNPIFLYFVVVFMTDIQYILVLSNINKITSAFLPDSISPVTIPWFDSENWPSDNATFFNMGTSRDQVEGIFFDMLVQIFMLIYFFYLSNAEKDLRDLQEIYNTIKSALQTEQGNEELSSIEKAVIYLKNYFYIFARFLVLGTVLLFITQGLGLLSAIYCIFCLIFIIKESNNFVFEDMNSYSKLLRKFIIFIVTDLTLQIGVQVLFNFDLSQKFESWLHSFGILKIWKVNDADIFSERYSSISYKIYIFAVLSMLYRMMKSKDYIDYSKKQLENTSNSSQKIAKKMAENFNDERIRMKNFYDGSKKRFEIELSKLEANLKKWNKKFYGNNKDVAILTPAKTKIIEIDQNVTIDFGKMHEFAKMHKLHREKPSDSYSFEIKSMLMSLINHYLFSSFTEKVSPFGKILSQDDLELQKIKDNQRKEFYLNLSRENENESDDSEEEVNLNEIYEKEPVEYNLKWNDYPFIFIYACASSTQELVYLSFFINHYQYASLESIIFPLSVVGYALMEYPRPPIRYFRVMLIYAEIIFFLKFLFQFEIWQTILGKEYLESYKDPLKIGFNLVKNTYSQTTFSYVLWDVIIIVSLLLHQYYLSKIGLGEKNERAIESLNQAKKRKNMNHDQDPESQGLLADILLYKSEEKPGKDFYSSTIFVQMIILIYIFCFFSRMDGNSVNISEAIKTNQFQGRMVLMLIFQICLIIVDRYFYLVQTSQAFQNSGNENDLNRNNRIARITAVSFRVITHMVLIIAVSVMIFWYLPINGNIGAIGKMYCEDLHDQDRCNNFEVNIFLQGFYFIYTIYAILSALQIRYGYPSFKRNAIPLMRKVSQVTLTLFKVYRKTPFFFEIRTLIDWVFTRTSLNIYQWLKFEDIYAQLFINKCVQKSLDEKKIGDPIEKFEKCYMGIVGLLVILFVIIVPLIIFSTLNPIIEYNKVITARLDISIAFEDRAFKIYTINTAETITDIDENEWKAYKLNEVSELTNNDIAIIQKVSMPDTSDTNWNISPPAMYKMCEFFINHYDKCFLQTSFTFKRKYPISHQEVQLEASMAISSEKVNELKNMICDKTLNETIIPNVFNQLLRLPSNGDLITPVIIEDPHFSKDLILTIHYHSSGMYWNAETLNFNQTHQIGVRFLTVSDRYSTITLNYSIITFYISIVFAVGTLIKYASMGISSNLNFTDMKKTFHLETLCAGVYVSRMIGDIKKEEELYYELIDILRSPEITKMLTGSSSIKQKLD